MIEQPESLGTTLAKLVGRGTLTAEQAQGVADVMRVELGFYGNARMTTDGVPVPTALMRPPETPAQVREREERRRAFVRQQMLGMGPVLGQALAGAGEGR